MKLKPEEAKAIVLQVHSDLDLYHNNQYPVIAVYFENHEDYKKNVWIGSMDYSEPIGNDGWGKYPEYMIIIDDTKKEAIMYGHYSGHYQLKKGADGHYELIKQALR